MNSPLRRLLPRVKSWTYFRSSLHPKVVTRAFWRMQSGYPMSTQENHHTAAFVKGHGAWPRADPSTRLAILGDLDQPWPPRLGQIDQAPPDLLSAADLSRAWMLRT